MLLYILQPVIELRGKKRIRSTIHSTISKNLLSTTSCFEEYKIHKDIAPCLPEAFKVEGPSFTKD